MSKPTPTLSAPPASTSRRRIRFAFLFYEIYADDAAFDAHRASPHLAAYRKRREDEGLLEGSVDVKVYRAITE